MGVIYRKKKIYGNNPYPLLMGGGGYAPVGTIISFMGTSAPQDYLPCDGNQYFIADFPQLSDFFEQQFGAKNYFGGNGTTTFAVPNLQGEFLRGTGTNSHDSGMTGVKEGSGANVGEHQGATVVTQPLPSTNMTTIASSAGEGVLSNVNADAVISKLDRNTATKAGTDKAAGWMTTRPTNTSVLYCIKAIGDGDYFSLQEHYVGQWIDHKPLYQITIQGTTINSHEGVISTGLHNIDYCELVDFQCSNGSYRKNMLESVAIKNDGTAIEMVADSESTFLAKSFTATILFTKLSDGMVTP